MVKLDACIRSLPRAVLYQSLCRPLRGLENPFNDSFPAINRWAIVGRPLRGLYSVFAYH